MFRTLQTDSEASCITQILIRAPVFVLRSRCSPALYAQAQFLPPVGSYDNTFWFNIRPLTPSNLFDLNILLGDSQALPTADGEHMPTASPTIPSAHDSHAFLKVLAYAACADTVSAHR